MVGTRLSALLGYEDSGGSAGAHRVSWDCRTGMVAATLIASQSKEIRRRCVSDQLFVQGPMRCCYCDVGLC